MLLRFTVLILIVINVGLAHAQNAEWYVNRDREQCKAQASDRYIWILNMTAWRVSYNTCLRERLQRLSHRYRTNSLEAIRLEDECPQYLMNAQPTELSMLGFEIVNSMTAKEMERAPASRNIEHHLQLYYQRTIDSRDRVRELRRLKP